MKIDSDELKHYLKTEIELIERATNSDSFQSFLESRGISGFLDISLGLRSALQKVYEMEAEQEYD